MCVLILILAYSLQLQKSDVIRACVLKFPYNRKKRMASVDLQGDLKQFFERFEEDFMERVHDFEEELIRRKNQLEQNEKNLGEERAAFDKEKKRLRIEKEEFRKQKEDFRRKKQAYEDENRSQSEEKVADMPEPEPVAEAPVFASRDIRFFPSQSQVTSSSEPRPPLTREQVIISHADSPSSFYVQKVEQQGDIDHISQLVNEAGSRSHVTASLPSRSYQVGDPCIALFSDDNKWYRGRVNSVENGHLVHYVDFGNSEYVPLANVRPALPELRDVEPMARKCSLANVKPLGSRDWSSQALVAFERLAMRLHMTMKVICAYPLAIDFELSLEDKRDIGKPGVETVAEALVSLGHAVNLVPQATAPGFARKPRPFAAERSQFEQTSFRHPGGSPVRMKNIVSVNPMTSSLPASFPQQQREILALSPIPSFFHGAITHIVSLSQFSVQALLRDNAVISMTSELQSFCANAEPITDFSPGLYCAAQASSSFSWERAKIVNRTSQSAVQVIFVDLGVSEAVTVASLRSLPNEFRSVPRQSFTCSLANVPSTGDSNRAVERMETLTRKETCRFKVVQDAELYHTAVSVQLPDGRNLVDLLFQPQSYLPPFLPQSPNFEVAIIHVDVDDGLIHAQLVNNSEELDRVQTYLAEKFVDDSGTGGVSLSALKPGQICSCQFPDDEQWYRGRIIDVDVHKSHVKVLYVDFGNTEIVSVDDVRLEPVLLNVPQLSFEMEQKNLAQVIGKNPQGALKRMKDLVNETFPATKLGASNDRLIVDLLLPNGKRLSDALSELIPRPSSRSSDDSNIIYPPLDSAVNYATPFPVKVTDVVAPDCVYVQRLYDPNSPEERQYRELHAKLNAPDFWKKCQGVGPGDIRKGNVCVARYSDGEIYRAKICEHLIENADGSLSAKVFYPHFGTTEETTLDCLRLISADLFNSVPSQAIMLRISGITPVGGPSADWTAVTMAKVKEIIRQSRWSVVKQKEEKEFIEGLLVDAKGNSAASLLIQSGHAKRPDESSV